MMDRPLSNFQVVAEDKMPGYELRLSPQLSTGVSLSATGTIVKSPGDKQDVRIACLMPFKLLGNAILQAYPLQKKRHTFEFLRTIAHLRPRTNTLGAVTRVRNALAFATHKFFQERDFLYIHTPIITTSDCEGAGKMFQVTTLRSQQYTKK